jgi:hypothetical protein
MSEGTVRATKQGKSNQRRREIIKVTPVVIVQTLLEQKTCGRQQASSVTCRYDITEIK